MVDIHERQKGMFLSIKLNALWALRLVATVCGVCVCVTVCVCVVACVTVCVCARARISE